MHTMANEKTLYDTKVSKRKNKHIPCKNNTISLHFPDANSVDVMSSVLSLTLPLKPEKGAFPTRKLYEGC